MWGPRTLNADDDDDDLATYVVNRPCDSFFCLQRSLNRHFELN